MRQLNKSWALCRDVPGRYALAMAVESEFLPALVSQLKRLLANEAAVARGELYGLPAIMAEPDIDLMARLCEHNIDLLAQAEVLVDNFCVTIKSVNGTPRYLKFRPAAKARRGGGKRGPSYKFGDEITAAIREWAAANKGVSPLPELKRLWASENRGVKVPPHDMTFRRYLRSLELEASTGSS
jgi:hypothetical protein